MKRVVTMICILLMGLGTLYAQTDRKEVRRGNRDFDKAKYSEAEVDYKKALIKDSISAAATFNLGNTYYKMEDYAQAEKNMAAVVDSLDHQGRGADAYYNLGSSYLKQRNWQGAVDAFKNSLRRNPSDMDAKSNLAYAQKMLENEQQQQDQNQDQSQDGNNDQNQDQNQNNDQNKNDDQNKDQNNGDDKNNNDQNQEQNQNNQNDQQDQNKDQNQQGQQPKISQQAAQQMLQAIQAQEDKTQEKVKKEKALQAKSKQKEKNW